LPFGVVVVPLGVRIGVVRRIVGIVVIAAIVIVTILAIATAIVVHLVDTGGASVAIVGVVAVARPVVFVIVGSRAVGTGGGVTRSTRRRVVALGQFLLLCHEVVPLFRLLPLSFLRFAVVKIDLAGGAEELAPLSERAHWLFLRLLKIK
jgi:hypothetical protein